MPRKNQIRFDGYKVFNISKETSKELYNLPKDGQLKNLSGTKHY